MNQSTASTERPPEHPQPVFPLWLLREKPDEAEKAKQADREADRPGKGRKLLCRGCRTMITTDDTRINVSGKHRHVFANPAGYLYELGCFSQAPGCSHEGAPSWEFTWFPGHSWQIQVCRSCNALMGWSFRPPSGNGFSGLILAHLIEEDNNSD
ncbi:cereblon family protein [Desulfovibrio ferrophilus]|uniref:CULT domain-containing protein n=1 Tax=Desulfovibrio ferrophilus TaxID=241368 RepID=A0A2Z6B2M5_9BACT|nr:cereblon family protein [Desulfovibrio ferrophilus]BBD09676.1 uncharacterized protein DFE_2950 [Desulfovibrio ferrophilus]